MAIADRQFHAQPAAAASAAEVHNLATSDAGNPVFRYADSGYAAAA